MILKEQAINYNYIGLQALYERLGNNHALKERIHSKILSAKAGIIGEKNVEAIFRKYSFPFDYAVLLDLNLSSNGKFKIDALFITRHYILILESKNVVGNLSFERDPFCLRRELDSGQVDIYESPEVQLERNINLLRKWLKKERVDIPVIGAIILGSTKSRVHKSPVTSPIMYPTTIPNFIWGLPRDKAYLSLEQFQQVTNSLKNNHEDYCPYPMCDAWGIETKDIIKGVQCPECSLFGMKKIKAGWYCEVCRQVDRKAHEKAINEWFILVKGSLNNKECREFLQLNSQQATLRIIKSMNLKECGSNKRTFYRKRDNRSVRVKNRSVFPNNR
ncbi:nuclease-related domain-containing protein [Psychrobacillus sp. FSL W7-1493]|uniref:nuclease-related domain-containing protein n=2 Tax=unclassified Psychrobacillus TaxID=2636677 RepID=UPI0030F9AFED